MKTLLATTALALGLGLAAANAAPIAAGSVMNITGNSSFTATNVTFTNPANSGVDTGDFAGFTNCVGCATMTNFTWSPFTAGQIYSVSFGGQTATLSVTSEVSHSFVAGSSLDITDNATMTLTGHSATPGLITMTFNTVTGAVVGSFSSTAVTRAVPEPGTLGLLGAGLVGLGFVVNRRRSA